MDYYQILKVKKTSSKRDIEKAYKRLALKCHPDKSDAPNAAEQFRLINEAYEILKDSNKRDTYDRFDLTKTSSTSSTTRGYYSSDNSTSRDQQHHTRRQDSFFTGQSDRLRKEQEHKNHLDTIKTVNKRLLEEANAAKSSTTPSKTSTTTKSSSLPYNIMPDLDDDEFERIVLDRLNHV